MALTCAPCKPIILRTTWNRFSSSMPMVNWHCRFSSTCLCCAPARRPLVPPPLPRVVARFSFLPCCCHPTLFFHVPLFFQVALCPLWRAPFWAWLSGCQFRHVSSPHCDRPLHHFGAAIGGGVA